MKITLVAPKHRNPYAPAARRRSAGVHRDTTQASRQALRRQLRVEIDRLRPSP